MKSVRIFPRSRFVHHKARNLKELFALSQVEIAFAQFDTSGDDKLNYKEFCLMIIQREKERLVAREGWKETNQVCLAGWMQPTEQQDLAFTVYTPPCSSIPQLQIKLM